MEPSGGALAWHSEVPGLAHSTVKKKKLTQQKRWTKHIKEAVAGG